MPTRRAVLLAAAGSVLAGAAGVGGAAGKMPITVRRQKNRTGLPAKVPAVYHYTGSGTSPTLASIPYSGIRLVWVCFGIGLGSANGHLDFPTPANQSMSSLQADVATLKAAGVKVGLSVGGQNRNGLQITTSTERAQFEADFATLMSTWDWDGCDIDLEDNQVSWTSSVIQTLWANLKASYGSTFINSCAPSGGIDAWATCAGGAGTNLDLYGQQFYDYVSTNDTTRKSEIKSRLDTLQGTFGLAPEQLMIGCKLYGTAGTVGSSTGCYAPAFSEQEAKSGWSGLRGAYVWNTDIEAAHSYDFINNVAPVVL